MRKQSCQRGSGTPSGGGGGGGPLLQKLKGAAKAWGGATLTYLCRQPALCPRCTRASKRLLTENSSLRLKKSACLRGSLRILSLRSGGGGGGRGCRAGPLLPTLGHPRGLRGLRATGRKSGPTWSRAHSERRGLASVTVAAAETPPAAFRGERAPAPAVGGGPLRAPGSACDLARGATPPSPGPHPAGTASRPRAPGTPGQTASPPAPGPGAGVTVAELGLAGGGGRVAPQRPARRPGRAGGRRRDEVQPERPARGTCGDSGLATRPPDAPLLPSRRRAREEGPRRALPHQGPGRAHLRRAAAAAAGRTPWRGHRATCGRTRAAGARGLASGSSFRRGPRPGRIAACRPGGVTARRSLRSGTRLGTVSAPGPRLRTPGRGARSSGSAGP